MAPVAANAPRSAAGYGLDKLGVLILLLTGVGAALPFATFRANRIVLGEGRSLWSALPPFEAGLLLSVIGGTALIALLRSKAALRLCASLAALLAIMLAMGAAARQLTPEGDALARVSPGAGFWVLAFTFSLFAADALTRLRLIPLWRVVGVFLAALALALLLSSGAWDQLSLLKEYDTRADAFWREARRHLLLAFGSLALAVLSGVPLGVLCHRLPRLRDWMLNVLNIVQTIPSIALFGLLIAPLAWIAANVPGAAIIGVSGIGAAPAIVALYAYSLLPVVSNTVVGLDAVPYQTREAARGMGMTNWQTLLRIEAPLSFPIILTGVRIVLVQNIGLATIAGLIGGGGFGVFVFQGMGQTAADLILLGALPTVLLAFAAAILLDAAIELSDKSGAKSETP